MRSRAASITLFIAVLLTAASSGCNSTSDDAAVYNAKQAPANTMSSSGGNGSSGSLPASTIVERKQITRGVIRLRVENIDDANKSVQGIIKKYGGYSANVEFNRDAYSEQISATFRTPADKFNSTIDEISSIAAIVESKNISVEDVTPEYIDVSARLNSKKDVEASYRELLKQAKTISEILSIDEKIGEIQAEIESSQGRLNYIANQARYSTIEVVMYKRTVTSRLPEDSFAARFIHGLANGFYWFLDAIIILASIWPFWIIILLTGYLIRRFRRYFRNKTRDKAKSSQT